MDVQWTNDWIIGDGAVASSKASIDPINAIDMPWMPSPSYEGRPAKEADPALGVKILRQDPNNGLYIDDTASTRLDRPPLDARDTWRSYFYLEGDYLMGTTGMINGGAYIFRPPTRPHGLRPHIWALFGSVVEKKKLIFNTQYRLGSRAG